MQARTFKKASKGASADDDEGEEGEGEEPAPAAAEEEVGSSESVFTLLTSGMVAFAIPYYARPSTARNRRFARPSLPPQSADQKLMVQHTQQPQGGSGSPRSPGILVQGIQPLRPTSSNAQHAAPAVSTLPPCAALQSLQATLAHPSGGTGILFIIHRSSNSNVVCYKASGDDSGVKVFW